MMAEVRIVRPGEGRPWWWMGDVVNMTATGEDTDDRFMMEEGAVSPGGGPAPHIQNREDECFYVLDGGPIEFAAGNRKVTLGAGGFIHVRSGTAHAFKNTGEAPAKLLLWNFPAGFDRFQFEAGEEPADPEEPRQATDEDRQKLLAVAPDFGIEMNPGDGAFEREPEMAVVEPATIESDAIAGQRWAPLAGEEDTGGRFAMYRVAVPPGEPAPQVFEVETAFYVLQGTVGLRVADQTIDAPAGTFAQLPAGTPIGMQGAGDQRAIVLIWSTPAHDLARAVEAP